MSLRNELKKLAEPISLYVIHRESGQVLLLCGIKRIINLVAIIHQHVKWLQTICSSRRQTLAMADHHKYGLNKTGHEASHQNAKKKDVMSPLLLCY